MTTPRTNETAAGTPAEPTYVLRIVRTFRAPAQLVFDMWTQREHLMGWFAPKGFTVVEAECDARPGGAWRSVMRNPAGEEHTHFGVFREVAAPGRLVMTHAWESPDAESAREKVIAITLDERAGVTTMTFEQSGFGTESSRDAHAGGWGEAIDILALFAEREAGVKTTSTGRQIVTVRVFDAPRELVFDAWTDPRHASNWWGPEGFTTTTHAADLRPGGAWRFTMHGPDGRDYENHIVYDEIDRPARLTYHHAGKGESAPVLFDSVVTFEEYRGDAQRTRLTLRVTFASEAERERVEREHGAVAGGVQTVSRLADHLAARCGPRRYPMTLALPSERDVLLHRAFDAPVRLVFDAWTKPEHVARWFGCSKTTMPVCEIDLRPGGAWRYELETADGKRFPMHGEFREIDPPHRLVYTERCGDGAGGEVEALTTVTFEERGGRTHVWARSAYDSAATRDAQLNSGMEAGVAEMFDKLEGYLATDA